MKKKNVVENTTKAIRTEPILGFLTAMPGGIEASERRGQLEFLESEILPTKIHDLYVSNQPMEAGSGRRILESWGFRFGKVCGGDTLFQQAKLPEGWSKKGSDHDMWSYIVDGQGRERCGIFYKAAFYDRSAHMDISTRFRGDVEYEDEKLRMNGRARGVIKDGENVIWTGEWRTNPTEGDDYMRKYGGYDMAQKDAGVALKAYPTDLAEQWALP